MNDILKTKKDNRITKKEALLYAAQVVKAVKVDDDEDIEYRDAIYCILNKEIEHLDKRTQKAREKAKKDDELALAIYDSLTTELQTINQIIALLDEKYEATPSKVAYRLRKMLEDEKIEKEDIKTEDGRKIKAYKLV